MRKEKMVVHYGLKTKKQEILVFDKGSRAEACCAGPFLVYI